MNWGGNAQGDQKKEQSGDVRAAADVEAKVQREREGEIAERAAVGSWKQAVQPEVHHG